MSASTVNGNKATASTAEATRTVMSSGPLSINLETLAVVVAGRALYLTEKEFAVLEILMARKGTIVTKEMMMNHLYAGKARPELKIIDVFVCKLRKKLSALSDGAVVIDTVWGRGFMLRDMAATPNQENQADPPDAIA